VGSPRLRIMRRLCPVRSRFWPSDAGASTPAVGTFGPRVGESRQPFSRISPVVLGQVPAVNEAGVCPRHSREDLRPRGSTIIEFAVGRSPAPRGTAGFWRPARSTKPNKLKWFSIARPKSQNRRSVPPSAPPLARFWLREVRRNVAISHAPCMAMSGFSSGKRRSVADGQPQPFRPVLPGLAPVTNLVAGSPSLRLPVARCRRPSRRRGWNLPVSAFSSPVGAEVERGCWKSLLVTLRVAR